MIVILLYGIIFLKFFEQKYYIYYHKTCFCISLCNSDFYEINLGLTKLVSIVLICGKIDISKFGIFHKMYVVNR